MNMKRLGIPTALFMAGLAVGFYYAFSTNYLTVYDASRDYWLYNYYRLNPVWHPMNDLYGLQNTAIFSSYIPGLVQWATKLQAEIFFKGYTVVAIALVPVVVYLISRLIVNRWYSVFSAVYTIGWVAFYQGGSFARLNFAGLIYGLFTLVLLSDRSNRHKIAYGSILAGLLPLAHYGTAFIALLALGGSLLVLLAFRKWRQVASVGVCVMVLTLSLGVWQVVINKQAWQNLTAIVQDTELMVQQGVGADVILRTDLPTGSNQPSSIMSRDRVTQAAFGVSNPDNAGVFQLNWWLLGFAWLTVMLMLYGCWFIFWGRYPLLFKSLMVFSLLAIGLTLLIPQVSRGYGLEKVFYQAIVVVGVGLIVGGERLSKRLHIPAYVLLSFALLPYVGLMWRYGVIPSVLG
jgi:hypothetical protein